MIEVNRPEIDKWLADPAAGPTLELNYSGTNPVTGRYVARGSTTVMDVAGAVAVLRRSANGSGDLGYYLLTSYPVPA